MFVFVLVSVCLRGAVVSHVRVYSQSCKHIEPCSVSVGVRKKLCVCARACVVSHVSTFNHDVMPLWCVCVWAAVAPLLWRWMAAAWVITEPELA